MLGYSGRVNHSDFDIGIHKTKKRAIEFLKQLAYESGEDIFTIYKVEEIGGYISLIDVETYKYSRKWKDWFQL